MKLNLIKEKFLDSTLFNSIKAEYFKKNKLQVIFSIFIIPLLLWTFNLLFMSNPQMIEGLFSSSINTYEFIQVVFGLYIVIVLTFTVASITSSSTYLEMKNDTLKLLYITPIKHSDIYLSKVTLSIFYLTISAIYNAIIILLYYFYLKCYYSFATPLDFAIILKIISNIFSVIYFATPLVMIHTFIGLRFKIYLLNAMAFVLLYFTSNIYFIYKNYFTWFMPYSYNLAYFAITKKNIPINGIASWELIVWNAILIVIIGVLGCKSFNYKKNSV